MDLVVVPILGESFWTSLWTAVVTSLSLVTILAWLAKQWIGARIEKDVNDTYVKKQQERKAEFDVALEEKKQLLSRELEGWKAGYEAVLDENRIRFTRLHADRADAIRELYVKLVRAEQAIREFTRPMKMPSENENGLRSSAANAFDEFVDFFQENRILLTEDDCDLIVEIRDVARSAILDYTTYDGEVSLEKEYRIDRRQRRFKAYQSITKDFARLRERLERDFREAMGMKGGSG